MLRAAATEAGYFGDRQTDDYGGTGEVTTTRDLRNAIDETLRGLPVRSAKDADVVQAREEERQTAEAEDRANQVPGEIRAYAEDNGMTLSDQEVAAAARLVTEEGMDLADAVIEAVERTELARDTTAEQYLDE